MYYRGSEVSIVRLVGTDKFLVRNADGEEFLVPVDTVTLNNNPIPETPIGRKDEP